MIYGNLGLAETYYPAEMVAPFHEALGWLRQMAADQPDGIIELQGKHMYVNVHGYNTLPRLECAFESHRRYVDLQYCIAGGEYIDYCRTDRLTPLGKYDPDRDFLFYEHPAEFSTLRMAPGDFAIFLPMDGHRPKVTDQHNAAIRKLVIKISCDLLPRVS